MAKHLLFLVHGVGDTKPGWSTDVQEVIRTSYTAYHVSKLMPFDLFFEFQEINYNDKFDDRRKQWRDASQSLIDEIEAGGLHAGGVTKLATWAKEPDKDGFINTHALDVALYRFISTVGQQVRDAVQLQILKALAKNPGSNWSIIAHSLGTSVMHGVLLQMFSPIRPPEWGPLPAGMIRPTVLMMVANVSRLLEDTKFFGPDGDVYRSIVHPSAPNTPGVCDYYINVRNHWDPIPLPRIFRPTDDWPDLVTRADHRYVNVEINAIQQPNVHSFAHYLRNPKTLVPLFRLLTVPGLLLDDEAAAISRKYEESTPLAKFEKEAKKLQQLSLPESEQDWRNILGMLRTYLSQFGSSDEGNVT